MDKIAVLIPCYNEAVTIKKVVEDFKATLPEAVIYVYDNNSSDDTAKIAKEAQPKEMWLTHFSPSLVRPLEYMDTVTDIFENAKAGKDGMSVNLCFED